MSPEGAAYHSPGQRPGCEKSPVREASPERAKYHEWALREAGFVWSVALLRPLQGW